MVMGYWSVAILFWQLSVDHIVNVQCRRCGLAKTFLRHPSLPFDSLPYPTGTICRRLRAYARSITWQPNEKRLTIFYEYGALSHSHAWEPRCNRKRRGWTGNSHWNGLKNVPKGLRDVKEGRISARKAGQIWGLTMKSRPWDKGCARSPKNFFGPSGLILVENKVGDPPPPPPGPSPGSATGYCSLLIYASAILQGMESTNCVTWRRGVIPFTGRVLVWAGTLHSHIQQTFDRYPIRMPTCAVQLVNLAIYSWIVTDSVWNQPFPKKELNFFCNRLRNYEPTSTPCSRLAK